MSSSLANKPMPRGVLIGAAAMIGLVLVMIVAVRLTEGGAPAGPAAEVLVSRDLHFADRPDGSVEVTDRDGAAVGVLESGSHSFLRATLRSLVLERRRHEVSLDEPFRVSRTAEGRLVLEDLATGREIDLYAFGPTNAGSFAQFLEAPEAAP